MASASDKSKDDVKEKTGSDLNNMSIKDSENNNHITSISDHYNDFFENFKQSMQSITHAFVDTWPNSVFFPTLKTFAPFEWMDKWADIRLPLCDVVDKGDKYEVTFEVPGIDKDKIDVKATKNSLKVSGFQSQKSKEKGKNYVYSERTSKSFHRQIPFPQEILPSEITAKVNNGVLEIVLPKRNPTKSEGIDEHKVNVT